ncbi:hypothetical protein SAMN04488502_1011133 [Dendrosporobacter quercicolus]|uniref:Uncharacterized protein n=1 Tax=Dendrosporobacter quercicolus TaxID=146817 RepID=A0A1G9NV08_9FIRM|nr:hypothetical protein SAMN04488502_1011133 [Dendrosporobacter quercicolus]
MNFRCNDLRRSLVPSVTSVSSVVPGTGLQEVYGGTVVSRNVREGHKAGT